MSYAALKLVATDPADRNALRFERRQSRRRLIGGRVTSLQQSNDDSISRNRICSLQMLDISDSGIGGILKEPVQLGTTFIVYFQPHGMEHGFDHYGHVVRCTVCDNGYRIGVRINTPSAA